MTDRDSAAPGGPPAEAWVQRPIARRIATNLMRLLPVQLYGRIFPRRAIGLCYHLASGEELPHVRHLYRYKSPEQFEADLVYLKRNFRVLSYEELAAGKGAERNGVVLSFDDGLAECFTVARPLLLEHGLPCIFFVSPPHLDNRRMYLFNQVSLLLGALAELDEGERLRILVAIGEMVDLRFLDLPTFARWATVWIRTLPPESEPLLDRMCGLARVDAARYLAQQRPYMTSDQVRTLARDGFTIGGHALRHVALGAFSPETIRAEMVESCEYVARLTGTERVPFAFPYDANGVSRDLIARIRAENPFIGLCFDSGEMRPDREFMLNRLIVDAPGVIGGGRSNLGGYLRNMYLDQILGRTPRDARVVLAPTDAPRSAPALR